MSKRPWWLLIAVIVAGAVRAPGISASEKGTLPRLETRVAEVAVFKDGYGFFVRSGKGPLEKGWTEFDLLPNACLGTVWVYTDRPEEALDLLVRGTRGIERTAKVVSLQRLLAANIGSRVVLLTYDQRRLAAGVLLYVSERTDPSTGEGAEPLILLEAEEGRVLSIGLGHVQGVEFREQPKVYRTIEPEKQPVLRAKVLTKREEAGLGLAYLQQGIRWLPSYLVGLKDEKRAIISLRATLVNEAEDLERTRLHLVIGVPHFSAKGELDPLGLQKALAATDEFREVGRAMMSQRAPAAARGYGGIAEEPAVLPVLPPVGELAGLEMEELYLYHKEDITLRKGERAQMVLLTGEVPYQHIYEWNADTGEEVWHCLKLTNTLKAPWTTGVAMTVKEGQPLGQDLLKYTPPGASTNLKVTQAPAIRVSRKEEEVSRSEPKRIGDNYWSLAIVKGELKLENYKKEGVEIEVEKTVNGKVESASDSAEIVVRPQVERGLNPVTGLKWKVSVAAGKSKILNYQYQVFVRV